MARPRFVSACVRWGTLGGVARRTASSRCEAYSGPWPTGERRLTITLHCLDCGFRFSLTLAAGAPTDDVAGSLSCGQCRCRRWAAA